VPGECTRVERRYRVAHVVESLSVAHATDGTGRLAGESPTDAGETHAAVVDANGVRDLGTLGGSFSTARGLNANGEIVGGSLTPGDEAHHGFVWLDGRMRDLNDLMVDGGWEVVHALAIDDEGLIVALASREGVDRVVVLEPLPSGINNGEDRDA
jgi:probable HAF family extracellular repeat protein